MTALGDGAARGGERGDWVTLASMRVLTARRLAFMGVLAALALVVVLAAVRLAMIPVASGGPVEEAATSPDPGAELTSEAVESASGPGAGAAPAEIARGGPVADVPEDTSPAGLLVAAARAGDAHCVRELLAGGVAADSESRGSFAIHGAAANGSVVTLGLLLAAGAHVEALDQAGNTALTNAALFGNADATALLVSAGADPNAYAEPNNLTPLMAVLMGWTGSLSRRSPRFEPKEEERFKAAWALIQAGADPHFGPGDHPPPVVLAEGLGGEIGRLYTSVPESPDRPR